MLLKKWEELPDFLRNEAVKPYYEILKKKKFSLFVKRLFDLIASFLLLLLLWPVMLIISVLVRRESVGPAIFRQERITQYGRSFNILKFRTMVKGAGKTGSQLTVSNDKRVTQLGVKLRNSRLDELPQLINILIGDMSFVGTRPDLDKYVSQYTDEMMATLLTPAGVTSEASIMYRDEYKLLNATDDVDKVYVTRVLPEKMRYNLDAMRDFGILRDLKTMIKTVLAVCGLLSRVSKMKNEPIQSELQGLNNEKREQIEGKF